MFMDYEIYSKALKSFSFHRGISRYMFTKSEGLQVSRIEVKMTGWVNDETDNFTNNAAFGFPNNVTFILIVKFSTKYA